MEVLHDWPDKKCGAILSAIRHAAPDNATVLVVLVQEVAVLADQRRRAGHAFTSDALEEWHRYNLPAFTERMMARLRNHCEDGHQPWPANGRYTRYMAETSRCAREDHCAADIGAATQTDGMRQHRPRFGLVDLDTGEIDDL
jgi:hypothetical protein